MDQIKTLRAAIARTIGDAVYSADVATHPRAEFTTGDLSDALKNRHCAVRVAFSGVPDAAQLSAGEIDVPCAFVAYVAAKDGQGTYGGTPGAPRGDLAIVTATAVMALVCVGKWGVEDTRKPKNVRMHSLYSGEIDTKSATVWSVSWVQMVSIPIVDGDALDLRPLLTLITSYDLEPADGAFEAQDRINMRP